MLDENSTQIAGNLVIQQSTNSKKWKTVGILILTENTVVKEDK